MVLLLFSWDAGNVGDEKRSSIIWIFDVIVSIRIVLNESIGIEEKINQKLSIEILHIWKKSSSNRMGTQIYLSLPMLPIFLVAFSAMFLFDEFRWIQWIFFFIGWQQVSSYVPLFGCVISVIWCFFCLKIVHIEARVEFNSGSSKTF